MDPKRKVFSDANSTQEDCFYAKEEKNADTLPLSLYLDGTNSFVHIFAGTIVLFDLHQYGYVASQKIDFPDATVNNTEQGKSMCDSDTNSTEYKMEQTIQEGVSKCDFTWN